MIDHAKANYAVYLIASQGFPRSHHAIFVANGPKNRGTIYQVTGNIQNGMTYETKPSDAPETDLTFESKRWIGRVAPGDMDRFASICAANPPPEKQFDGPKRIDPSKPVRRCQEWTAETIRALKDECVLLDGELGG